MAQDFNLLANIYRQPYVGSPFRLYDMTPVASEVPCSLHAAGISSLDSVSWVAETLTSSIRWSIRFPPQTDIRPTYANPAIPSSNWIGDTIVFPDYPYRAYRAIFVDDAQLGQFGEFRIAIVMKAEVYLEPGVLTWTFPWTV